MTTPNSSLPPPQTAITLAQCTSSETWKTEIQKVLPKELLIEAFLRVTRTVAGEQKFLRCDPKTFLSALLKCARAGLMPDGIHAHLIPFGQEVSCIFDWKGVVDVASRNGIEVVPKVICSNDDFSVQEDDGSGRTVVHHKWGMGDRGEIVGYYSRARKKDGSADYEFMTLKEVESVRQNYSNAKNSKAWDKSFDEMGKKTVIKRHSKRWPISQEVRAALNDDSDEEAPPIQQIKSPVFEGPIPPALAETAESNKPRRAKTEEPLPTATQQPQPTAASSQATAPAETVPPATPIEEKPEDTLLKLCAENGITLEQFIVYLRKERWMKTAQTKLTELSTMNLKSLVAAWRSAPEFGSRIKKANEQK